MIWVLNKYESCHFFLSMICREPGNGALPRQGQTLEVEARPTEMGSLSESSKA